MISRQPAGSRDCGRRHVKTAAAILATALSTAPALDTSARDGNFQSVLLDAGCPNAKVDKVSDREGTITYRANCFSTSHKVIIVTCVRGICLGARQSQDDREDHG
ncbi:hypothetical protein SAMN04488115_103572 [Bosea lathyri]|uniref:Uncharacterized protein n=1 Tax=Bosea lathyri TaxID=1036778 RepID=A0A1H5Y8H0_9HYPH|nr:hypothetical protein SAMN04488115_103572 [Bosea lathyri]